jgi:hypothetical protein
LALTGVIDTDIPASLSTTRCENGKSHPKEIESPE